MARGDGDAVRPKTRQRFRDAIEKINAPLLAGGPLGGGLGFDTSFTAIRSRMLQKRMAMGARMWDDGSTALTCLIKGSTILVANAGDSRAVACLGGKTVPLSVDHKPNLPAERARVQAAGGTVTCLMGCYRVMGMLAMSRALGDVIIEQYLSQEPDVVDQTLSHRDFVVMASDGLWDVLSNQEVVQLVQTESSKVGWNPEHLTTVANKVCMEAFRRGSMDNISVMIVLALGDVKSHEVAQKGESLGRTRQRTFNSRYRGTLDSDSNTLTTLAPHAPNGHRSLAALGAGFEKRRREQGTMMHPGKVGGMVMGSSADPRDRLGMSYSSMPHLAGGLKSGNGILPRSQVPQHSRCPSLHLCEHPVVA
jgi:serine/threonine protein phosphatase PrpC